MERNTVSKKSVNGGSQVSGGFIFDQMDRFAHDYAMKEQNIKGFLFTQEANIVYRKQICNWDDIELKLYLFYDLVSVLQTVVHAVDKKDKKIYAIASFFFVEKDHAYCDTKGE